MDTLCDVSTASEASNETRYRMVSIRASACGCRPVVFVPLGPVVDEPAGRCQIPGRRAVGRARRRRGRRGVDADS